MSRVVIPAKRAERAASNFAQLAAFKDEGERRRIPQILAEIHAERQWLDLGYDSWDAACDAVLGGWRLALPRDERREVVAGLRDQGMSTRAIGSAVGVHHSTVADDLSTVGNPTVDEVMSLDGRPRPATQPPRIDLVPGDQGLPEPADEIPDNEAAALLHDLVDGSADVRRARLRHSFAKWLHHIHQHHHFDPNSIADVSPERARDVRQTLDDFTKWATAYLAATDNQHTLRVITGGHE